MCCFVVVGERKKLLRVSIKIMLSPFRLPAEAPPFLFFSPHPPPLHLRIKFQYLGGNISASLCLRRCIYLTPPHFLFHLKGLKMASPLTTTNKTKKFTLIAPISLETPSESFRSLFLTPHVVNFRFHFRHVSSTSAPPLRLTENKLLPYLSQTDPKTR